MQRGVFPYKSFKKTRMKNECSELAKRTVGVIRGISRDVE